MIKDIALMLTVGLGFLGLVSYIWSNMPLMTKKMRIFFRVVIVLIVNLCLSIFLLGIFEVFYITLKIFLSY